MTTSAYTVVVPNFRPRPRTLPILRPAAACYRVAATIGLTDNEATHRYPDRVLALLLPTRAFPKMTARRRPARREGHAKPEVAQGTANGLSAAQGGRVDVMSRVELTHLSPLAERFRRPT